MKNVLSLVLVIILVVSSVGISYGAVIDNTVAPFFISVAYHTNTFDIDSDGEATYLLIVCPHNTNQLTQVKATIKIENRSTGANSYSTTINLPYNSLYDEFRILDSYTLTKPGIYEFNVTYKCYSNGVLLETITANPKLDSF